MSNPTSRLYTWAIAIQAASKGENFDCILVPSEIADMAVKKHGDAVKVGKVVSEGNFEKLTIKQLQKLAQANSISIARTKKDFIKLLKPLETDIDFDSLKGAELKSIIKKHKIGALRSKEELIALLKKKIAEKEIDDGTGKDGKGTAEPAEETKKVDESLSVEIIKASDGKTYKFLGSQWAELLPSGKTGLFAKKNILC